MKVSILAITVLAVLALTCPAMAVSKVAVAPVVPEPSSLLAVVTGIGGLLGLRKMMGR